MLANGPACTIAGLVLCRAAEGGVNGIAHPGGHGAGYFQVAGGNRFALLIIGYGNIVHSLPQVSQVPDNGQHSHQLGADGNAELGLHQEAVHTSANADDDVAQTLGAEVHNPAHLYPVGVDIQAAHLAEPGQLLVIIVALVLHSGSKRYHRQVVSIHDVVDITGKTHGEFGMGNKYGVAAAGSGALDIHRGTAGRLADTATHILPLLAQTFHKTHRGGCLAFAQRRGGNRGHLNVLAVRLFLEPLHYLQEIELGVLSRKQVSRPSSDPVFPAIPPGLACSLRPLRQSASLPFLIHRKPYNKPPF